MSSFKRQVLIKTISSIISILLILAIAVICFSGKKQTLSQEEIDKVLAVAKKAKPLNFEKSFLTVNGYTFSVEIADTNAKRERGLMFREKLNHDEGMLFVYDEEQFLSFWMRNTLVPLSIAFIDKNKTIVSIHDMQPLDLTSINSAKEAIYALEVAQGRFKELKIKTGMKVQFELDN